MSRHKHNNLHDYLNIKTFNVIGKQKRLQYSDGENALGREGLSTKATRLQLNDAHIINVSLQFIKKK